MVVFPNAKINLGLNIVSKRTDGFHNIESCFFPVAWNDILEITPNTHSLEFKSTGIEIPGNTKSNLCTKAFLLLESDFKIPPVHIHLHKQIPIGAGLGGGSSDGAFALKTISQLYNLNLSIEDLQKYAEKLGSDCPFFIENRPIYCYEKGNRFENINFSLKNVWVTLIYPNIHCSTKEAYSGVIPKKSSINCKKLLQTKGIESWKEHLKNDFEDSIFKLYPEIEALKNQLYKNGASYASMSGSGSTLFGIFKNKPHFTEEFNKAYSIKTLKLS